MDDFKDLYEKTLLWHKGRKQTSGHKVKKAQQKRKSQTQYKSDSELKRLSKISAKRAVTSVGANSNSLFAKSATFVSTSSDREVVNFSISPALTSNLAASLFNSVVSLTIVSVSGTIGRK